MFDDEIQQFMKNIDYYVIDITIVGYFLSFLHFVSVIIVTKKQEAKKAKQVDQEAKKFSKIAPLTFFYINIMVIHAMK